MSKISKVLITGATGCLGQNATEQLLSNGVLSVRATGRNWGIGQALLTLGAEFVPLDLTKASAGELAALVKGCDAVWFCAGTHPDADIDPDEHERLNFIAARDLFRACMAQESVRRFVYVSSSDIYTEEGHQHEITEDFRSNRIGDAFTRSKVMAETFFKTVAESQPRIRTTVIRAATLYGPYERNWVLRLVDEVKSDRVLRLPRGGGALRDFAYVGNVVYAMYLATLSPSSRNEFVNVTDLKPMQVSEFARRLLSAAGVPFKIAFRPLWWLELCTKMRALKRAPESIVLSDHRLSWWTNDFTLNAENAQRVLGYNEPLVPAEEALEITGSWVRGLSQHE